MTVKKYTVGIETSRGYLRLRLPNDVAKGSQRYIHLGLPATVPNQRIAQEQAWQIEDDLQNGSFDWTFVKYKPKKNNSAIYIWNLTELWGKYCDFMRPQLAETTYEKDYKRKFT
jgi:integrase